jgi:FO synthase
VKLGTDGAQGMLQGGADDLGGTLMEETISRMAGSAHGSRRTVAELEQLALDIGRTPRQRTTTYGPVDPDQAAAARRSGGVPADLSLIPARRVTAK